MKPVREWIRIGGKKKRAMTVSIDDLGKWQVALMINGQKEPAAVFAEYDLNLAVEQAAIWCKGQLEENVRKAYP